MADRFGRSGVLAATIFVYAIFTGAAALSQTVWQLGLFLLLAGIGIGGEWALAGTYVAEAWPEDRRKMGAGYLQTGYYFGFFIAAALNYTVGARFGWRAMFLCGLSPVLVSLLITLRVKEPKRWKQRTDQDRGKRPTGGIFGQQSRKRTIVNAALLTVAIIGLWAGSVYEPTAIITLAKKAGMTIAQASKTASLGTVILSIGTILGCLAVPILAERLGRKKTLAVYFAGMCVFISLTFGRVFYTANGLKPFIACLFFPCILQRTLPLFTLCLPHHSNPPLRAP